VFSAVWVALSFWGAAPKRGLTKIITKGVFLFISKWAKVAIFGGFHFPIARF
jgi:hypothetical protein